MSEEKKEPQQPPKQPKQKISLDLPKDLTAVYANVSMISHSLSEIVIDFAQVLPRTPRGKVQARVIMSPMHAKILQMALAQNIATYEQQYGQIRIPRRSSPLADSFFRFSQEESGDDSDDPQKNDDKE